MIPLANCVFCKSDDINTVYSIPDKHYGIKGKYIISRCVEKLQ
jgi:hypothetical protein